MQDAQPDVEDAPTNDIPLTEVALTDVAVFEQPQEDAAAAEAREPAAPDASAAENGGINASHTHVQHFGSIGCVAQWLERRSLTGELSLASARSVADM